MAEGRKSWMERNLEEPFFQIEMARCEISKKSVKGVIASALVAITIVLNLVF